MKRFDYLAPQSLVEALEMLARRPEATPLAGGTDILVQLKEGYRSETALLSLKRVPDMHQLSHNGQLTFGSAVTMTQITTDAQIQQDYSTLASAAGLLGSVQTRNMATVGGNICNASPSADTAPPLLALGAQVVIASLRGERTIPLEAVFKGPGETVLQPGELLTQIIVPNPPARSGSSYTRHTPRAQMDIAVVGVAVAVTLDADGFISKAGIALGAVAPTPIRSVTAEALLLGHSPTDTLLAEVGLAAARDAKPIDDIRASAEYRRHLVDVLTQYTLRDALARIEDKEG